MSDDKTKMTEIDTFIATTMTKAAIRIVKPASWLSRAERGYDIRNTEADHYNTIMGLC